MIVPDEVLDACRAMLATLSLEHGETASSEELRSAFQGSQGPLPETMWNELFSHMDVDGDGRISLAELVAAMAGVIGPGVRTATHRFTFDLFDRNSDGYLDREELQVALKALGRSGEDVDTLLQAADLDGNGRLEYVEFLHLLGG